VSHRSDISRIYCKLEEISLLKTSPTISQCPVEHQTVFSCDGNQSKPDQLLIELLTLHNDTDEQTDAKSIVNDNRRVHQITGTNDNGASYGPPGQSSNDLVRVQHAHTDRLTALQITALRSTCPRWCSCICHKRDRLSSPHFLNQLLGALSVGYTALPYFRQPCNERRCQPRPSSSVRVTYRFPSWFLSRVISVLITSVPGYGPTMTLRTLKVIPDNEKAFIFAEKGDIDGLKNLFSRGLASIDDVDSANQSLLDVGFQ
jgi:hypothetical protein